MKQITIQIPDDYADVITVTCIGTKENVTNITVEAFDIRNSKEDTVLKVKVNKED